MDQVPPGFGFEPRSPRCGPFLVLGLFDTNCAHSGPFLAILGPFLGHIVELEGNKGLFVTRKSRRTWSTNRFPSIGGFEWVSGPFWAKKGCFWAQNV